MTIEVLDTHRAASQRIGSRYQRDALARRSLRPEVNRYDPQRAPWVRGFFPGDPLPRTKAQPLAAALLDAIAALPADEQALAEQSLCEQRLEQWIALGASPNNAQLAAFHAIWGEIEIPRCPLLASFRPGAAAPIIRPPTTRPPTAPAEPRYTILDTGGVLAINSTRAVAASPGGVLTQQQRAHPGPLYAIGFSYQFHSDGTSAQITHTAEVPELSIYVSQLTTSTAEGGPVMGTIPLGLLVPGPLSLKHRIDSDAAGGAERWSDYVALAYRNVRSSTPRPDLPTFPESYEPPPITGTLWADFTAAAIADLEAAGVILGD